MTSLKSGAEIIVEGLIEAGTEVIFGFPGGAVIPLYNVLYDAPIKHILTRHEQGAAHAADGYARATGRVGVCVATSGPGATNLVTGLATAHMDSIPLVAITGQVPVSMIGNDSFQEADIYGISIPITNWEDYGVPPDTVKGGLCTSGMYDFEPVSLSYRNTWVNFTDKTIELLSPIKQWQFLNAPLVLIVGTKGTPEFIRQTEDFFAFLQTKGKNVKYQKAWGYNHFEGPETLANPYGYFGRAALELMGLEPNKGKKH